MQSTSTPTVTRLATAQRVLGTMPTAGVAHVEKIEKIAQCWVIRCSAAQTAASTDISLAAIEACFALLDLHHIVRSH